MNPADIIGAAALAIIAAMLVRAWVLRSRVGPGAGRDAWVPSAAGASPGLALFVLGISVLVFLDCSACRLSDNRFGLLLSLESLFLADAPRTLFTEVLWLSLYTLPVFFLGACAAGFLSRTFERGRLRPPRSMAGAAALGALLPMCSCGAAPLASSLAVGGRTRPALVFLLVAPVLSPTVMVMSWGVLGWQYLVARIAATLVLAFGLAALLGRLAIPEGGLPGLACEAVAEGGGSVPGCAEGCGSTPGMGGADSGLLRGWRIALELHPYILLGIVLGAVVSAYLPEEWVRGYFSHPWLGLFAASGLGIPVYMCTGEEIPLLEPLIDMGLPLGHAISFTITGNAVCVASYLVLVPLFGKRVAVGVIVGLLMGSVLLGAGLNLLLSVL